MRSSQQHFVVPILPLLLLSAAVPAAHGVGVEVDASGNVAGGLRAGRIPRVVHYVLADRGARFFDWTMYVSVKAALNVLRADEAKIHLLDGAEPWGGWFAAVRPLVTLVPFAATHRELNGVAVEEPAHIADFRRFVAAHGGPRERECCDLDWAPLGGKFLVLVSFWPVRNQESYSVCLPYRLLQGFQNERTLTPELQTRSLLAFVSC